VGILYRSSLIYMYTQIYLYIHSYMYYSRTKEMTNHEASVTTAKSLPYTQRILFGLCNCLIFFMKFLDVASSAKRGRDANGSGRGLYGGTQTLLPL
jgi:hypothetical protein